MWPHLHTAKDILHLTISNVAVSLNFSSHIFIPSLLIENHYQQVFGPNKTQMRDLVLTFAVCVFMHVFTKFDFLACNAERLFPRTISLKPHVDMQNTCTSILHVYSSTDKYNISNGVPDQQYTWQTLYLFIQSLLFAPMNKPPLPLQTPIADMSIFGPMIIHRCPQLKKKNYFFFLLWKEGFSLDIK